MGLTRYPSYKPSGIEWLGEIPRHWNLKKLKHLAKIRSGKDHKEVSDEGGSYPIIGTGGEFGKANAYLYGGPSVILGRKGTIDRPQFIGQPFWAVDTAYFTEILKTVDPRFFYYCCTTIEFDRYSYGSAVPSMSQETLSNIIFATPSTPEQTAIADYLDRKTAQIDTLIANKRRMIELLKEERMAVINEAVNGEGRGWERKKLKYVAKLNSGDFITSDDIRPHGEFPVYGGNGLRGFTTTYTHDGAFVLIGRQGALCGNINYATGKFYASEHAVVTAILGKDEVTWLGELLRSLNLNQYSQASAQPGLSVERIQNLDIPYPSLNIQKEIVFRISIETARIENTLKGLESEISLLNEYKACLINETVTGKLKVI